ncbi:TonB-dependent receptor [uncultured Algimonas sp.]|uniref:TonB-dependent receptor domain-containing protein n=1 Tax=uncultured Algimonas sp. TaxID=1547920 RepID=UPI0026328AE5|nr:TonB-dependent receptor [uncultured Algimonas sp.]
MSIRTGAKRSLKTVFMTGGAVLALMASAAQAQADTQLLEFSIPEQDLGSALTTFALQSNQQILFAPDLVADLRSKEVSGAHSAPEAIEILLSESGLDFQLGESEIILLGSPTDTIKTAQVVKPKSEPLPEPAGQVEDVPTGATGIVVDEEEEDEVVVTGSRIKRDTASSVAPLRIITTEVERDFGLFDSTRILQQSQAASGAQIDQTLQGALLDNGPGSSTLNLRGLGANRTLLLMNGRRLAPSGVEGAPSSPSLNQLPTGLIERFEVLLDGASAVYGSDAVGGVVNVITKRDFDGLELNLSAQAPTGFDTLDYSGTATWGKNFDRGFIGVGAEYFHVDEVRLTDRKFLRGCTTHVEVTETGEIRRLGIRRQTQYETFYPGFSAVPPTECAGVNQSTSRANTNTRFATIHGVPGNDTNIGIPGYFDESLLSIPIDGDSDGRQDIDFVQFTPDGNDITSSLTPEENRVSLMAYGEYTLDGKNNLTPYFEAQYSNTRVKSNTTAPALGADVGENNPFNPCGVNGVDCNDALRGVLSDPGFINRFQLYNSDPDTNRDGIPEVGPFQRPCVANNIAFEDCTPDNPIFGLNDLPTGSQPTVSFVSVDGDRDNFDANFDNYRVTTGIKGDLPGLTFGPLSGWTFDTSLTYSLSSATSVRTGVRGDRLAFAIGNNPLNFTADAFFGSERLSGGACDPTGVVGDIRPDVLQGCVPVNLFASSLYEGVTDGGFATQAERDYLFDERSFKTDYQQILLNGFLTGKLLDVPAGNVNAVLGFEWRSDDIASVPNDVASQGLLSNTARDRGASGNKWTRELFAEIEVPVFKAQPLAYSLDVNLSGRLTDDQFYGTNGTYSVKVGWRPISELLIKGTYGTAFRAPNLRENFLEGQIQDTTIQDPCAVPLGARAFDPVAGGFVYDGSNESRDPVILDACRASGADPTTAGIASPTSAFFVSAETLSGGTLALEPETSRSFTTGASYTDNVGDLFGFNIDVSYYDFEISNATAEPSPQFIVADCLLTGREQISAFCDNITRDNATGLISSIDSRFINRDGESVRGIDYNLSLFGDTSIGDKPLDLFANVNVGQLLERTTEVRDNAGEIIADELVGGYFLPEFTGEFSFIATLDKKWGLNWRTRYIGGQNVDEEADSDFGDALGTTTTTLSDGSTDFVLPTFSDTCGGPAVGDVTCRDKRNAEDYFESTVSIRYSAPTWSAAIGIGNVFDQAPPEVDVTAQGGGAIVRSNVPVGVGYDLLGRNLFVSLQRSF